MHALPNEQARPTYKVTAPLYTHCYSDYFFGMERTHTCFFSVTCTPHTSSHTILVKAHFFSSFFCFKEWMIQSPEALRTAQQQPTQLTSPAQLAANNKPLDKGTTASPLYYLYLMSKCLCVASVCCGYRCAVIVV